MTLKSILKIQFVWLTTFVFSCGDDEVKLSFKNQDVQGKMFGASWEYADGSAAEIVIDGQDMFGVNLYAGFDDDLCAGPGNDTADDIVGFYAPMAVGLYKLKTDPDFPMLHVAMIDVDDTGVGNPTTLYAYEGAIEILSISESEITGRVVARHEKNIVNGNFTVSLCNESE